MPNVVALGFRPEIGSVVDITEDVRVKILRNLTLEEAAAQVPQFVRTVTTCDSFKAVLFFAECERVTH